jgi:hypothetical protein
MHCPDPVEEPAVKTVILDNDVAAKRAANQWVTDKEGKAESGVWVWWTDGSQMDNGRVGAAADQQNVLLSLGASGSVWELSDQNPKVVKSRS